MKILVDCILSAMPCLIGLKQCCVVKGRTIHNNLNLVHTIIKKVDDNVALINLDQSKAYYMVNHDFLEAVLSAAGFAFSMHPLELWWKWTGSNQNPPLCFDQCINVAFSHPCSIFFQWNLSFTGRTIPVWCSIALHGQVFYLCWQY